MCLQKALAALTLLILGIGTQPLLARQSVLFQHQAVDPSHTDRIVVKWRTDGVAAVQMERVEDRATRLSGATGIAMSASHNLFGHTDVMLLDHVPSHAEMQRILGRLNADPAVEYAEPDAWRYLQDFPATSLPNDPHFVASTDPTNAGSTDLAFGSWVGQWYLLPSSTTTPASIGATDAWKITLGSPTVVVAVIDSGVLRTHPDLAANMTMPGFDFVSCDQGNFTSTITTALGTKQAQDQCSASGSAATYNFSNDGGQNWHADGTDPGDFLTTTDAATQLFIDAGCTTVTPSTWHGTKVAGVIGAVANNGMGVAGVAPNTTMLSARVIGKCSARMSDIAAAILWAAGQPVTISTGSIAASPAANIINISLGSPGACTQTEQDAINTALAAGVFIVAAAGNEGGALDAPANCTGVVSVVGLRHTGDKLPVSNLSSDTVAASIAAPSGNCVNTQQDQACLFDIETTTDASSTTPSVTPNFYTYALLNSSYVSAGGSLQNEANLGTSYSAPMVAGTAALMLAVNPKLTPGQILARMQASVRAFPTSSPGSSPKPGTCTTASTALDGNGNFIEPTTPAECICTTQTCGAGMLDSAAAVTAATEAFVQITPSKTNASPGQKVTLDGSGSTASTGATIVGYQWTTDPATSNQLINPNEAIATLVVPTFRSIGVTLTITESTGKTDSASIIIESSIGAAAGRTSGGLSLPWLGALGVAALWQLRQRRKA